MGKCDDGVYVFSCCGIRIFLPERDFVEMSEGLDVDAEIGKLLQEFSEQKKREYLPNLLQMDYLDRERLADQVEKSGGKVRIVVHPEFNRVVPEEGTELWRVRKAFEKMIGSDSEKSLPMIIFVEGGSEYEYLKEMWKEYANPVQLEKMYLVPTYRGDPRPIHNYRGQQSGVPAWDPYQVKEMRWKDLVRVYRETGIENCLIGGENLVVADKLDEEMEDQGSLRYQTKKKTEKDIDEVNWNQCVGQVATRLAREFEVEFSSVAFPHRRMHALGARPPSQIGEEMWTRSPGK